MSAKPLLVALSMAVALPAAIARTPAPAGEHAHDHAAEPRLGGRPAAGPAAARPQPPGAARGPSNPALARMDEQIAALRAVHARLAAAPPGARVALLEQQMQLVRQALETADGASAMPMPAPMGGMAAGAAPPGGMPMMECCMDRPMQGGATPPTGAGMMDMHRLMVRRVDLLTAVVQALADRAELAGSAR